VEACVINRPLTYVHSEGFEKPLTSSQLLCGRDIETLPALMDENEELETYEFDPTSITRRHRKVLKLIKIAWEKWSTESILTLRDRDRKAIPGNKTGNKVPVGGDVIIMLSEHNNAPLQLRKIIKLTTGRDGEERIAGLKTKSGETFRSFSKLAFLESSLIEAELEAVNQTAGRDPVVDKLGICKLRVRVQKSLEIRPTLLTRL
jgi:hypothetical protein